MSSLRHRCLALALAAGAWGGAGAQESTRPAATPELMQALARGGYVIYFRHGHTHWQQKIIEQSMQAEGRHDLANCATQRNLDDLGRDDARRIHAALQAARIPVGAVLSSLYCRPAEYVAIITSRTPERVRWLTGLSTPETLREIKRAVATPPPAGTNVFMGGHGDRPFDLTGLVIQEGDALVFDPRRHRADDPGKFAPVAWIKPAEWLALTGAAAPVASAAPTLARIAWPTSATHDADNQRASLPMLVEGSALDPAALRRALQLVRENAAKNVEVTLAPGAAAGTEAQVAIAAVRPWSLGAGLDHASAHGDLSDAGGLDRVWFAATHANLWNRDHQATLRLSHAARGEGANHSIAYRAPLPRSGTMLGIVATRAHEAVGLDAEERAITGAGRSLMLYARQHLDPRADYHHHLQLSLADRRWTGAGEPRVRSRPLALAYAGHWEQEWIGWKFALEGAANLPGGRGNDDASYAQATAGGASSRRWQALRAQGEWMRVLTYDIRLRLAGRAQWSDDGLIAGEQFALGGSLQPWGSSFGLWPRAPWLHRDGLRGLPERSAAGDRGAAASAELWSRRLWGQDLRVGGFVDLGLVQRRASAPGLERSEDAASLGLNLHWQQRGRFALSASLAHVPDGGGAVRGRSQRVDVSIAARF
jgi:hemolysin activation/secretion protein/phosphohistidine phosphatase SixA